MCLSFLNVTVKTALKSVDFDKVTDKNKLAPFLTAHDVYQCFRISTDDNFIRDACAPPETTEAKNDRKTAV